MGLISAITALFRRGTRGFTDYELRVIRAVEERLEPLVAERLRRRVETINPVQRLDGGREVNAFSMKDEKAYLDEALRVVPRAGEQKLADVIVSGPPGTGNRCTLWLVDGHFFSLEFDETTAEANSSLIRALQVDVLLPELRRADVTTIEPMPEPSSRPAVKTKFWDGQPDHPFFALLSARVEKIGFAWRDVHFDDEVGVATWRRPLFDGYELELSLMAQDASLSSGVFDFTPALFVVSERQATVWNESRLWECSNLVRGNRAEPETVAATIVVIGLRWLIRAWHEPKGTAWPVPGWRRVRNEDAVGCADEVAHFLGLHLPRFLTFVRTPEALAHTMLNFESFPGNDDGNGPISSNRSVYAAILLHDLGRTDEALKELSLEERQDIAAVHRGMNPQHLDVTRCRIERLSRWMKGE